MYQTKDPNSIRKYYDLYLGYPDKKSISNKIGYLITEYQVLNYNDVQVENVQSVNKPKDRRFFLHATQRIVLFNESGIDINPDEDDDRYLNYPVLLKTNIEVYSDVDIELMDYSPKTVNTQIQESGSQGQSEINTVGKSSSNTVGSSFSDTNSFGTSVSISASPLNSGVSANYEHSSTSTYNSSNTAERNYSNSKNRDLSESSSMSIKDWGAYSHVNPKLRKPTWIFGQEYPWSSINFRKTTGDHNPHCEGQVKLKIPNDILIRLSDDGTLFPPSQLSMFGIDFVMKAFWKITLENDAADEITLHHWIHYFSGSHLIDEDGVVSVYMDNRPYPLTTEKGFPTDITLNLPIMALDVLGSPQRPATIGFTPNKFTVLPKPIEGNLSQNFKIISTTNTLFIEDITNYTGINENGFGFSATPAYLNANLGQQNHDLRVKLFFKVVDSVHNYKLTLKHWIIGNSEVKLTFIINNDENLRIEKVVDSREAEGGEDNLLIIALRNLDYSAIDYHDYLQLGLNSIEILIQHKDNVKDYNSEYRIRAIAIE